MLKGIFKEEVQQKIFEHVCHRYGQYFGVETQWNQVNSLTNVLEFYTNGTSHGNSEGCAALEQNFYRQRSFVFLFVLLAKSMSFSATAERIEIPLKY